jgi:hypothetical protein
VNRRAKIFLAIAGLVAVVAAAAAVVYRPYYSMPENPAALTEQLVAARAVAEQVAARPVADRQLLESVLDKMAIMLKGRFHWEKAGCPPPELADWKRHEAKLLAIPGFDRKLAQLTDGGFVLQQPRGVAAEPLPVGPLQVWFSLQLLTAVREVENGFPDSALERLGHLTTIVAGLYDTPYFLFVMLGTGAEIALQKTVLYLASELPAPALASLQAGLAALPDPVAAFLAAMPVETAFMAATLGGSAPEPVAASGSGRALWKFAAATGYLERETLRYVQLVGRESENLRQWHESGLGGAPQSVVTEDLPYSPIVRMGWPAFEAMIIQPAATLVRRKAVGRTLEAEAAYRAGAAAQVDRLAVGGDQKIVLTDGRYCFDDPGI